MKKSLFLGKNHLGNAVFSNRIFEKFEKIIEFKGEIFERSELPKIETPEDDRFVQIGRDKYLGPSGDLDDYINHSCNPNSGLKIKSETIYLISIKKIPPNTEITWDYSTTMDEDDWEMQCYCGSSNCRGIIKDFKYLPKKIQKKYIQLNIVPNYILSNLSI